MKKRIFMALLVLGVIVCFASSGLAKQKVIKWKVQGFVPAGMLYHDNLLHLSAMVKEVSGGRLVFEPHPAGSLVHPFEGLKAVSDGVYQANYGYAAQWVGKIAVSPIFCATPGGFNTIGQQMWLSHGGGHELWQEMYDKYGFNVKIFVGAPIAMEDYMWSKKPMRTVDDMRGVKMRMMPLMGDVLSKHGMSVVFMPGGEIMPNLQRGVIQAAEYSIPAFDKTMGIWEICKYVMLPGIHQPCSATEVIVNKKAYAALPDDLKTALLYAIERWRFKNYLWMESKNLEAVEFFKQKGIETIVMETESVKTMIKWAEDYMDELAAKDAFFAKVLNSQRAFAKKWYPYHRNYSLPH